MVAWSQSAEASKEHLVLKTSYTAVIKQAGRWWVGWIEEVPGVNCQKRTRADLLETLQATLREAIEFNREDARKAAGERYEEASISLRSLRSLQSAGS
jgi:predicted RNase H-like HicB family nuclease